MTTENKSLNENSTYLELKEYFDLNRKNLPKTLNSECRYYQNVPATTKIYIELIDKLLKEKGQNIKKCNIAKSYKNNLYALYVDLQDHSQWNLTLDQIPKRKFVLRNGTM